MIAQPEVWLRLDASQAQPIHVEKALKKAMLSATLTYDFSSGSAARSEAVAQFKVPFRDATNFRCETDVANSEGVGFSTYIEEDPVRSKRTQWTPAPEGGLRYEISGGGETTSGSLVRLPASLVSPVLNPLLLIPALGSSRRAGVKNYGAYFVAGRRIYAVSMQKQTVDASTYQLSFCRVPDSPGTPWASLDWSNAQNAELDWADGDAQPTELRANAPLIGTIRVELA
ncbi:MAG: hypothetical protein V4692_04445 [Bdellovibrionota bacterium]